MHTFGEHVYPIARSRASSEIEEEFLVDATTAPDGHHLAQATVHTDDRCEFGIESEFLLYIVVRKVMECKD